MTDAQPIPLFSLHNHIPVLCVETLPDGVRVVIVTCADYEALRTLPRAISYDSRAYGRSGWDSDRCVAFYRTDVRLAEIIQS